MIKLFVFARRRVGLTRAQYHHGLRTGHAPLVRACHGFRDETERYVQNHLEFCFDIPKQQMLESNDLPFENCSEFWYRSLDQILRSYNNADYFRMLRPDEGRWSDPATRIAFLAKERTIVKPPAAARDFVKIITLATTPRNTATAQTSQRCSLPDPLGKQWPGLAGYVENTVIGELDFRNARLMQHPTIPFVRCSEIWVRTRDEVAGVLSSLGKNLGANSSSMLEDGELAFLSIQNEIFGGPGYQD